MLTYTFEVRFSSLGGVVLGSGKYEASVTLQVAAASPDIAVLALTVLYPHLRREHFQLVQVPFDPV